MQYVPNPPYPYRRVGVDPPVGGEPVPEKEEDMPIEVLSVRQIRIIKHATV